MKFKSGLAFSALFLCISVSANEIETNQTQLREQIQQAIKDHELTPRKQWAFEVRNYENEEGDISSSVASYNPQRDKEQRWQLLSIDGETPSQKQQRKFSKRQNSEDKEKQQSYRFKLRDIIQLDSLQLASEDEKRYQANFKVELEKLGKKASKKLQGVLTYNKENEFIEKVVITNTDSFSPVFSADIKEFSLSFDFSKIQNAILPQKYHLSMKGTFAFFTEIDEVSTNTFSDYRLIE